MRYLFIALFPFAVFAAATPQECLNVSNGLDRRYCLDKHIETVKSQYEADQKAWTSTGITQADKEATTSSLTSAIAAKKDHIQLLQTEMALAEKQLDTLKTANVVAASAPAAAKKKKKKSGLRIKW